MYMMIRLAGVSAVLAGALVLFTGQPATQQGYELRPSLLVTID